MKTLNAAKLDQDFRNEVASRPGADSIKKCFSCGTCTGACPVFRVEAEYNPRKIIRMILLGMRKEVLSSKTIWLCARCYACTAHCPQGVSFADVMVVLRDMAVKAGFASPDLQEKTDRISLSAAELRKDCLKILTGASAMSKTEALEKAKKAVEGI